MENIIPSLQKAQSFPLNGKMSIANATLAEKSPFMPKGLQHHGETSCVQYFSGSFLFSEKKRMAGIMQVEIRTCDITSLVAIVGEFLELWSDICKPSSIVSSPTNKQIQKSHDLQVTLEPDSFSANADLYQICMSNWHQSIKSLEESQQKSAYLHLNPKSSIFFHL